LHRPAPVVAPLEVALPDELIPEEPPDELALVVELPLFVALALVVELALVELPFDVVLATLLAPDVELPLKVVEPELPPVETALLPGAPLELELVDAELPDAAAVAIDAVVLP
jgi:hypothetical protein